MRAIFLFALALLVAPLSGCFGDDGGDDHCDDGHEDEHCPEPTPTPTPTPGPGGNGNVTPPAPNVLPEIILTVTDANGTAANFTDVGGMLTFDASLSSDPDGKLEGVAVTVNDGNRTRVGTLFEKGKFQTVSMAFDQPGVVNVTVAAVDDRAGFAILDTNVFVNHPQDLGTFAFVGLAPAQAADATACAGFVQEAGGGSNPVDSQVYHPYNFALEAGATYVEAVVTTGSADIAICNPDGVAVSPEGAGAATTDPGADLTPSADPTKTFYVAAFSTAPDNDVAISVVVHYEPRAAA